MDAAQLVVSVRASGVQQTVGGLAKVEAAGKRASATTASTFAQMGSSGASAASSLRRSARQIAGPLGLASVGLAAVSAGKEIVGFDRSMRNVSSIAKLNERQFKSLSKQVNSLAGPTAQAPKTLADGLYQLVSSGFNANDSMTILKTTAIAATAGLTDTATATTAVAGVLNAYKLKAKDAGEVSDVLFQTVNRGVLSFQDLAQGIGPVLPFAAKLGIGLREVGALTATLTKAGIPAAEAFTYQKGAMAALLKPTDQLKEAYKKLGVTTGTELVHKTGSLQGALETLFKTAGGTEKFTKLFPDLRGLTAALTATGTGAKDAQKELDHYFSKNQTQGSAKSAFSEQTKSISGQWDRLKSTVSGVLNSKIDATGIAKALGGVTSALKVIEDNKTSKGDGGPFDGFARGVKNVAHWAGKAGDAIGALTSARGFASFMNDLAGHQNLHVTLTAKIKDETRSVLNYIENRNLKNKVVHILGDDSSAKHKIYELEQLGISGPTAHFIAEMGSVAAARAAVAQPLSVPVTYVPNVLKPSLPGALPSNKHPNLVTTNPRDAAGRSPGRNEVALVGEGGGPEWIGSPGTGWEKVTGAQFRNLKASDYVIPTESAYRGKWEDIGKAFGLPGFKKGKGPSKKEIARRTRVDAGITNAGTSADTAGTRQEIAQGGSSSAFNAAKKRRLAALRLERKRIVNELRRAKGSRRTQLLNQLAGVDRDLQSTGAQAFEPSLVSDLPDTPQHAATGGLFGSLSDPFASQLALAGLQDNPATTVNEAAGATAAILKKKQSFLEGALGQAQARGDSESVTQIATALQETKQSIYDLTDGLKDNTAALQAQADLAKQQLDETRKALNTSQAELRAFGKYVVGVVSGQVGQTIGRGLSTPVPGYGAGY